jgi:hypothetical protein
MSDPDYLTAHIPNPTIPRRTLTEVEHLVARDAQLPAFVLDILAYLDARASGFGDYLEVGLCKAGTACSRVSRLASGTTFVGVDPYGDRPYIGRDGEEHHMYSDALGALALSNLFVVGQATGVTVHHWRLTSLEFIDYIIPRWFHDHGKSRQYCFGSIVLDGSHETDVVLREVIGLAPFLHPEGTILIDNMDYRQKGGGMLADMLAPASAATGLSHAMYLQPEADPDLGWDPIAVLTRDAALLEALKKPC